MEAIHKEALWNLKQKELHDDIMKYLETHSEEELEKNKEFDKRAEQQLKDMANIRFPQLKKLLERRKLN